MCIQSARSVLSWARPEWHLQQCRAMSTVNRRMKENMQMLTSMRVAATGILLVRGGISWAVPRACKSNLPAQPAEQTLPLLQT